MVLEFEDEDIFNGLPVSTPPYTICPKCRHNKCVPLTINLKEVTTTYTKNKLILV